MPVSIGAPPEHDFANPLGLMTDCHRRIERFLDLLVSITRQARGAELTGEQHEAAELALGYFSRAAPRHTADEEESLFPRLLAVAPFDSAGASTLLERLHLDHQTADELHREVDGLMSQWLAEGGLSTASTIRLTELLQRLTAIYREHIAAEEGELFSAGRTRPIKR